jgi:hypothetical protein
MGTLSKITDTVGFFSGNRQSHIKYVSVTNGLFSKRGRPTKSSLVGLHSVKDRKKETVAEVRFHEQF